MTNYFFLFILLLQTFAFCSEQNLAESSIYHSVNVITGEYCEAQTDLEIEGEYGITIQRYFDPYAGWIFNHANIYTTPISPIGEVKTDRGILIFEYDSQKRLTAIKSANKQREVICYARIQYSAQQCRIETSDGQYVNYQFSAQYPTLIEEVKGSFQTVCRYKYEQMGSKFLVVHREKGEGQFVKTEYYDAKHKDAGKVKLQYAPLGIDATPIKEHEFIYHDGWTEFFDAAQHKVIYRYAKNDRLTAIESFDENQKLYRSELFFWDESLIPNLISRATADANRKIQACQTFVYDAQNHLTKTTIYGNLTGKNSAEIVLLPCGQPFENGIESYSTHFIYSKEEPSQLLFQKEDNGITTQYGYDAKTHQLVSKLISDTQGIKIRHFYFYDESGRQIKCVIDDGHTETFSNISGVTERKCFCSLFSKPYDSNPEYTEETFIDLKSGSEKLIKRTKHSYSKMGLPEKDEIFDANGQYRYAIERHYDDAKRPILIVNEHGHSTRYEYDQYGNKIKEITNNLRDTLENQFVYDYLNRIVKSTEPSKDKQVLNTTYRHDVCGNIERVIDPLGNEKKCDYDAFNRLVKISLPPVLDEHDNPYSPYETREHDIFDRIIKLTTAAGHTTTTVYNSRGKPILIKYADGTEETFEYLLDGTLACMESRQGISSKYYTDFLGQVILTENYDQTNKLFSVATASYSPFHLLTLCDSTGTTSVYDYNGAGLQTDCHRHRHDEMRHLASEYDALGNLIKQKSWFGKGAADFVAQVFVRDTLGSITETRIENAKGTIQKTDKVETIKEEKPLKEDCHPFVNRFGQTVWESSVTDELGNTVTTIFDALNRPEIITRKNCFGQKISTQECRFDGDGNKILERFTCEGDNRVSFEVNWKYGPEKRIESITEAARTAQQATTSYEYDDHGRLLRVTKPDNVSLNYVYDELNRIICFFSSDQTVNYQYEYDAQNNVSNIIDNVNKQSTQRFYNSDNSVIKEILGNSISLSYEYDLQNRRTKMVLPDASQVQYEYDGYYLKKISRLSPKGNYIYDHAYQSYDLSGRLKAAKLIGQLGNISFKRDSHSRLTHIHSPFWSMSIPEQGFDPLNNIKSTILNDAVGEIETRYEYDASQQITHEDGHAIRNYQYDGRMNRTLNGEEQCINDDANRLVKVGNTVYTYDKNGCMTKKSDADGETNYRYDALNRMVEFIQNDTRIIYGYDSFGRRLTKTKMTRKTSSSAWTIEFTEKYIYDGDNDIGTMCANGTISHLRILGLSKGAELGASVAIEINGDVYAPIHDMYGSICCLVNIKDGSISETYRYCAFGETVIYNHAKKEKANSVINNPWQYCSKRVDMDTGLICFGKRDYDAVAGRWTTPDPLGFADGINRYAFVQNNPLKQQDLYGLFSFGSLWNSIVDAVKSAFDTVINTAKTVANFFQNNFLYKKNKAKLNSVAEEVIGKNQLFLMGYYNDQPFAGVQKGRTLNKVRITAINGILNLKEHWEYNIEMFSKMHGGVSIHYVLHPTDGWTWDLIKTAMIKLGFLSPQAKLLANTWKKLIQEMGGVQGNGVIVHYAHSIGGTDTMNAKKLLTPEEQKLIHVITVGSATMIPNTDFGSVVNYISRRDFVFVGDPLGFIKSLFDPNTNVIRIGSFWGPPLIDHLLTMETYRRLLEMLGEQFVKKYA